MLPKTVGVGGYTELAVCVSLPSADRARSFALRAVGRTYAEDPPPRRPALRGGGPSGQPLTRPRAARPARILSLELLSPCWRAWLCCWVVWRLVALGCAPEPPLCE